MIARPWLDTPSGAIFSHCASYRYALRRTWGESNYRGCPFLLAILLNPSTADARQNDPTVTHMIRRATRLGYNGLLVGNIFAARATDPKLMESVANPVGPQNDAYLTAMAHEAATVIVGWGVHGAHRGRGRAVLDLLARIGVRPSCLGVSKDGHPRHPLYVGYDVPLQHFPLAHISSRALSTED